MLDVNSAGARQGEHEGEGTASASASQNVLMDNADMTDGMKHQFVQLVPPEAFRKANDHDALCLVYTASLHYTRQADDDSSTPEERRNKLGKYGFDPEDLSFSAFWF